MSSGNFSRQSPCIILNDGFCIEFIGDVRRGAGNPLGCACGNLRGPSPYDSGDVLITVARGPVPRDLSVPQSVARDRPSPYGKTGRFSRSAGALGCHTRIRAGFPRERPGPRTMARDRPSPYDSGDVLITVARGPVPRDLSVLQSMARDRPSPYGKETKS